MSGNKHIARSGAKQGQWVACSTTPDKCNNGDAPVTNSTLNAIRLYKNVYSDKKVPLSSLREADYDEFNTLPKKQQQEFIDQYEKEEAARQKRLNSPEYKAEVADKKIRKARNDQAIRNMILAHKKGNLKNVDGSVKSIRIDNNGEVFAKGSTISEREREGYMDIARKGVVVLAANQSKGSKEFSNAAIELIESVKKYNIASTAEWPTLIVKVAAQRHLAPVATLEAAEMLSNFYIDARDRLPLGTTQKKNAERSRKSATTNRVDAKPITQPVTQPKRQEDDYSEYEDAPVTSSAQTKEKVSWLKSKIKGMKK
jgi:hypothetical protein